MPNTLQEFLTVATETKATDLIAALKRLSEEKRNWSPGGTARTALDQVAECAINNDYTAYLIETRKWREGTHEEYLQQKAAVAAGGGEALEALLKESTARMITVIRSVRDEQLNEEVVMPWETSTVANVIAYPYWNMVYHEAQINYIDAILESK